MDPHRGTRATYDRIAERFLSNTRNRTALEPWLDAFSERVPKGGMVLDVGGGPGFDAAALRARGLRAATLDVSISMLRVGERDFPGPRLQADMRRLPVRPGSLQGIWSSASLLHLERPEVGATLRGFHVALEEGGVLLAGVKRGTGAGWETERYGGDAPRYFTYWSEAEFDAELTGAGFEIVESRLREGRATWIVRHAVAR